MRYLLDTNVLSEITKSLPDTAVIDWLYDQKPNEIWVSVLTMGEIERGILLLKSSPQRKALRQWFQGLKKQYAGQTLDFDEMAAHQWAEMYGRPLYKDGVPKVMDSLIAAFAKAHGFILVTRNVKDMPGSVKVLNPWKYKRAA